MQDSSEPITALSLKGFKSFSDEQRIEIRPLTLLAGANSSGKSSILQPALLLKQTLEATYDPGPLLLQGPHVSFTASGQFMAKTSWRKWASEFFVSIETGKSSLRQAYVKTEEENVELVSSIFAIDGKQMELRPGMSSAEIEGSLREIFDDLRMLNIPGGRSARWEVFRDRCFLRVGLVADRSGKGEFLRSAKLVVGEYYDYLLRSIIHVPGLRGNPVREYKATAVSDYFVGTFENYVASVILEWQREKDSRLDYLGEALLRLGLTWGVSARPIDATQVELQVGRLSGGESGNKDFVNIADVGFGVSQVLPVLVALLVAAPGQLVYIEQPELHLHPRAQQALASVLAQSANRGVRVVAETHSSILLLAVQAMVAKGKLPHDSVKLHWFQRDSRGATKVTSGDLDQLGAYGDWPEDFGEVLAASENSYLDAVEAKSLRLKKNAKK